jgi:hypothetical protein
MRDAVVKISGMNAGQQKQYKDECDGCGGKIERFDCHA